jgi:hypothetical protein
LRFNEHLDNEDGPLVFAHACKMGLEGIVSKRKDSPSPSPARNNVCSASRDIERPCANSPRETSLGRASKMLLTRLRSPCSGMTPIPGWCTASARRRRTRPCSALRRCHKVCLYLYRISHVGPIASRIGESEGVGVGSATDLSRPKLSRSQECS